MFNLFSKKKTNPSEKLKQVLGDYDIPSFPSVVMKALEVIRNPSSSSVDISDVLSADPGLSVQVLKTINSAAYSPRNKVEDLSQAVMLMGTSTLESIVVSVAVTRILPRTSGPGFCFPRFWNASVQRAFVARSFANYLHPAYKSFSFTAGLLQDMAVPFLINEKPNDYGPILEKWHVGNDDLARLERGTFDWDHAEVAAWLCQQWGLPENLTVAIGESHGTLDLGGQCPPAVMLVSCLRESEEDSGVDLLIETALHRYNVSKDTAFHCVEDGLQQAEDFIQTM